MKSKVQGAVECSAKLQRHPADHGSPVTSIDVRVSRSPAALLKVTYSIRGELEHVRIPALGARRIAEQLWRHTCCELFVRAHGTEAYHEFNFAPSGEWASYAFERYREGFLLRDETLDPGVRVNGSEMLELHASVQLAPLSDAYAEARLALGLSAVIEARDGARSYWALAHPAAEPDFHHRGAFALEIDALRD
jgi:hypothetical protein